MGTLIPLEIGKIWLILFFYKAGFGIKKAIKADMSFNKKPNQL